MLTTSYRQKQKTVYADQQTLNTRSAMAVDSDTPKRHHQTVRLSRE